MQSTRQTSVHEWSFVPMHGSVITDGIRGSFLRIVGRGMRPSGVGDGRSGVTR
jgi:hypothetical protein